LDFGQRAFDATCAACHGVDGKGSGPFAEQLKSRLPDLPYNQAAFVRSRSMVLLAYMNQLQVK
jgi:mono/diheme cytochrome c family protein